MVAKIFAISTLLAFAVNALSPEEVSKLPQIELVAVLQADASYLPEMKQLDASGAAKQIDLLLGTQLAGKVKAVITGLTTTSASTCYNAPPALLSAPDAFSSSLEVFVEIIEKQPPVPSPITKRPGLQAALLATTDKTHVGFSDPAKSPNVNRIVFLVTDAESEFVPSGSKMKGDGTDTCASGPPDAAVLAKILKERDVILVVLAVGDKTVTAYKSYASALTGDDRNLYHVIASEKLEGLSLKQQQAVGARMLQQDDVQALLKYLKARFESQGAELPHFVVPTKAPGQHTGATTSVHGAHALCMAFVAASLSYHLDH